MIQQEDKEYIAAKIYSHYTRPAGIHNEKLVIYTDWVAGGVSRGRYSYMKNETIYSYFLCEKDGNIAVFTNNKISDMSFVLVPKKPDKPEKKEKKPKK